MLVFIIYGKVSKILYVMVFEPPPLKPRNPLPLPPLQKKNYLYARGRSAFNNVLKLDMATMMWSNQMVETHWSE